MGRPRKRRFVEEQASAGDDASAGEDIVAVPARVNSTSEASTGLATSFSGLDDASAFISPPIDPGLGFLDETSTPNFDFLDLLPPSYNNDGLQIDPQILMQSDGVVDGAGLPFTFNAGADLLGGINFDEPDTSTTDMSKTLAESLQRHWASNPDQQSAIEPPESCSSGVSQCADSPGSHSGLSLTTTLTEDDESQKKEDSTPKAIPSVSCGCLSSLYLALDSLSRIPSDIPSAMRVARNATKVAHDVIKCSQCSDTLVDDPTRPPPIQCFQNLMCLAALVPSACNAYASILEMLDKETAAANKEQRSIYFSFKDIGGLFGTLGESVQCTQASNVHKQWLKPDVWRTTMRAVLRIDVYGFTESVHCDSTPLYHQKGLKDVVTLLEERSKRRHDKLDSLVAEGKMPHTHYMMMPGPYRPVPPEQRNCIKILEAARIALDNLVIA